jgi:hypothetical protein
VCGFGNESKICVHTRRYTSLYTEERVCEKEGTKNLTFIVTRCNNNKSYFHFSASTHEHDREKENSRNFVNLTSLFAIMSKRNSPWNLRKGLTKKKAPPSGGEVQEEEEEEEVQQQNTARAEETILETKHRWQDRRGRGIRQRCEDRRNEASASQQEVTEETVMETKQRRDKRGRRRGRMNTRDEEDEEDEEDKNNNGNVASLAATTAATLAATTCISTAPDPLPGAFAMRGRRKMEDDLTVEEEREDDYTEVPVPLAARNDDSSTPHIQMSETKPLVSGMKPYTSEMVARQRDELARRFQGITVAQSVRKASMPCHPEMKKRLRQRL